MANTAVVLRSIFGAVRTDIRPLIYAVDVVIDLIFSQGTAMDDIFVTNEVYPEVAALLSSQSGIRVSASTASRRVERLANKCWDTLKGRELVRDYIGAPLKDISAPRDMLFYLAFYVHLDVPFFTAIEREPSLLF